MIAIISKLEHKVDPSHLSTGVPSSIMSDSGTCILFMF